MTIVKALLYQNIRNKMLLRIYVLLIATQCLFVWINMGTLEDAHVPLGSGGMIISSPNLIFTMPLMFLGIFIGTICGEDFKDKCAYYELLSGKGRFVSFLSRALFSVLTGAVLMTVAGFATLIFAKTAFSWGNLVAYKDVLVQTGLLFFPYLRYSAFLVMMTFLIRNPYVIYGIGFLMLSFLTIGENFLRDISDHTSAFFEAFDLYKDISNQTKTAFTTSVVSSVVTVIYLLIAYLVYRRKDLN